MTSRLRITVALVGMIVLVLGGWLVQEATDTAAPSDASGPLPGVESGLPVEPLSSLPPEAEDTWRLVESDGPFPYPDRDGSVFGNREQLLPERPRGYYEEYTVPTPGESDRGARRLVTGDGAEVFYTADHYDSFVVVDADS